MVVEVFRLKFLTYNFIIGYQHSAVIYEMINVTLLLSIKLLKMKYNYSSTFFHFVHNQIPLNLQEKWTAAYCIRDFRASIGKIFQFTQKMCAQQKMSKIWAVWFKYVPLCQIWADEWLFSNQCSLEPSAPLSLPQMGSCFVPAMYHLHYLGIYYSRLLS